MPQMLWISAKCLNQTLLSWKPQHPANIWFIPGKIITSTRPQTWASFRYGEDHYGLFISYWRDGNGFAPYQSCMRIKELMMSCLTIEPLHVWDFNCRDAHEKKIEVFFLLWEKLFQRSEELVFRKLPSVYEVKCNEANLFPSHEN